MDPYPEEVNINLEGEDEFELIVPKKKSRVGRVCVWFNKKIKYLMN